MADVRPGPSGSHISQLTAFAFVADDGVHGEELWTSDGTPAGTRLARDLCPGACSGVPQILAVAKDGTHLLLLATGDDGQRALWIVDALFSSGTGTFDTVDLPFRRVAGVCDKGCSYATAAAFANPPAAAFLAGATPADTASPLVAIEVQTAQATVLHTFGGGSYLYELTAAAGRFFFSAADDAGGQELWATDGTAAGTVQVADLEPADGSSSPSHLTALGNNLVFTARTGAAGDEPWISDGTAAGTRLLRDIYPGPDTFPGGSSFASGFTAWNGRAYFAADSPGIVSELWATDGSTAGTVLLKEIGWDAGSSSPAALTAWRNRLFFVAGAAEGGAQADRQPWTSDGSTAGTRRVTPAAGPVAAALPFQALGDQLYLAALDALWKTDGTPAGTSFVPGILNPDGTSGYCGPQDLTSLAGRTYLLASRSEPVGGGCTEPGVDLFTLESTGRVAPVAPTTLVPNANPPGRALVPFEGRLVFAGRDAGEPSHGDELWATDGTATGTQRVAALAPAAAPGRARGLTAVGSRLFFAVFLAATGEELWTSDGTPDGTHLVADLNPGPASASPQELTAVDGHLVFAATDGSTGLEPWVSDGTAAGTFRLADVAAGADASSPSGFTLLAERVYFAAADRNHGRELWSLPRSALGAPGAPCQADDTTLCLGHGRFAVTVRWTSPNAANAANAAGVPGDTGTGHAVPYSEETGRFWFFNPADIELLVKILDGGAINQRIWFFSGALSDVAYDVTVTDLASGSRRTYRNPAGTICGQADTAASPSRAAIAAEQGPKLTAALDPTSPCPESASSLCLLGGRFQVEAMYRPPGASDPAPGTAVPATDRSGYFWFFGAGNLELAVKILDGRTINQHFWVFAGALTDVEHTLTVLDRVTGVVRSYRSPQGQICGSADVEAF